MEYRHSLKTNVISFKFKFLLMFIQKRFIYPIMFAQEYHHRLPSSLVTNNTRSL